eukprot:scaffold872_cov421-Prasinococcus_capsulatus_cf.AAC.3
MQVPRLRGSYGHHGRVQASFLANIDDLSDYADEPRHVLFRSDTKCTICGVRAYGIKQDREDRCHPRSGPHVPASVEQIAEYAGAASDTGLSRPPDCKQQQDLAQFDGQGACTAPESPGRTYGTCCVPTWVYTHDERHT